MGIHAVEGPPASVVPADNMVPLSKLWSGGLGLKSTFVYIRFEVVFTTCLANSLYSGHSWTADVCRHLSVLYPHSISRVSRIVSQGARTAGYSGFMVADRCVSNDFHGYAWMCVCVWVCMDYIAHCEKQIFCREHC